MVTFSFHWRLVLMPPPTPRLRGRECRYVVMPKPQAEQEDGCLHFLDKCSLYATNRPQDRFRLSNITFARPASKRREPKAHLFPFRRCYWHATPGIFYAARQRTEGTMYVLGVDRKWCTAVSETVTSSWVDFLYVASSTWILILSSFHVSDLFQRYTHHNTK